MDDAGSKALDLDSIHLLQFGLLSAFAFSFSVVITKHHPFKSRAMNYVCSARMCCTPSISSLVFVDLDSALACSLVKHHPTEVKLFKQE